MQVVEWIDAGGGMGGGLKLPVWNPANSRASNPGVKEIKQIKV